MSKYAKDMITQKLMGVVLVMIAIFIFVLTNGFHWILPAIALYLGVSLLVTKENWMSKEEDEEI